MESKIIFTQEATRRGNRAGTARRTLRVFLAMQAWCVFLSVALIATTQPWIPGIFFLLYVPLTLYWLRESRRYRVNWVRVMDMEREIWGDFTVHQLDRGKRPVAAAAAAAEPSAYRLAESEPEHRLPPEPEPTWLPQPPHPHKCRHC
jgi:hypothetical protein